MLKTSSEEFDRYISKLYYDSEFKNRVITSYTINNSKRLLESMTTETRTLYNRIAKIDDAIYYDLNNDRWQCIRITKDGWDIVKSPMIFSRVTNDMKQVQPRLLFEDNLLLSEVSIYMS